MNLVNPQVVKHKTWNERQQLAVVIMEEIYILAAVVQLSFMGGAWLGFVSG